MLLVFTGIFTFLVDAYPQYAASAMAANSFARCSFAGKSSVNLILSTVSDSFSSGIPPLWYSDVQHAWFPVGV